MINFTLTHTFILDPEQSTYLHTCILKKNINVCHYCNCLVIQLYICNINEMLCNIKIISYSHFLLKFYKHTQKSPKRKLKHKLMLFEKFVLPIFDNYQLLFFFKYGNEFLLNDDLSILSETINDFLDQQMYLISSIIFFLLC